MADASSTVGSAKAPEPVILSTSELHQMRCAEFDKKIKKAEDRLLKLDILMTSLTRRADDLNQLEGWLVTEGALSTQASEMKFRLQRLQTLCGTVEQTGVVFAQRLSDRFGELQP